jgi:hypothetical protein
MARLALPILCSLMVIGQSVVPAMAASSSQPELKFKIYSPSGSGSATSQEAAPAPASEDKGDGGFWTDAPPSASDKVSETEAAPAVSTTAEETAAPATAESTPKAEPAVTATEAAPAADNSAKQLKPETAAEDTQPAADTSAASTESSTTTTASADRKVLQGYIRVVPTGTKIPIIMDTAVDSDTSQEGDEFSARTSEDLNIDGATVVPAGSVIKGRIAALNAPRALMRGGSVALKFDTVTTPDNRQIPLVATIVARGGVVHARRGMKDIAIDTSTVALPTLLGLGIGAIAGNASSNSSSSSSGSSSKSGIGLAGGALIGAGVGIAIGAIILCAKKGKKVDVRPGDELKIELAEDLRMPM